jgi:hypothetical protein
VRQKEKETDSDFISRVLWRETISPSSNALSFNIAPTRKRISSVVTFSLKIKLVQYIKHQNEALLLVDSEISQINQLINQSRDTMKSEIRFSQ